MRVRDLVEALPRERRAPTLVLLVGLARALAALSVTAEAPAAAALDTRVQITTGKAEGSPPPELQEEPPADRIGADLNEWARKLLLDPAGYDLDLSRLRTLKSRAELAVERRRYRPPARPQETERETRERCLKEYAGTHYADAAVREGCSGSWFRKIRQDDGRDPRYGHDVEPGRLT